MSASRKPEVTVGGQIRGGFGAAKSAGAAGPTTSRASVSSPTEHSASRVPAKPVSRKPGKTDPQRKLTVDVPEPVYNEYEDLFLELKRKHRRLKRVEYAPLVIQHGLNRQKIDAALSA